MATSQVRNYQGRLGEAYPHEAYLSDLTDRRDRFEPGLSSANRADGRGLSLISQKNKKIRARCPVPPLAAAAAAALNHGINPRKGSGSWTACAVAGALSHRASSRSSHGRSCLSSRRSNLITILGPVATARRVASVDRLAASAPALFAAAGESVSSITGPAAFRASHQFCCANCRSWKSYIRNPGRQEARRSGGWVTRWPFTVVALRVEARRPFSPTF